MADYELKIVQSPECRLTLNGKNCEPFINFLDEFAVTNDLKLDEVIALLLVPLCNQIAARDIERQEHHYLAFTSDMLGQLYRNAIANILSETVLAVEKGTIQ